LNHIRCSRALYFCSTNNQNTILWQRQAPISIFHAKRRRHSYAPESLGFNIAFGNNIYINLETDTRQETKRLYDALSKEGKVIMPLADMFWGAYFGTCTDKFGVNWMFNCPEPLK